MSGTPRVVVADPVTSEFEKRWRDALAGMPVDLGLVKDQSLASLHSAVHGASVVITKRVRADGALLEAAGPRLTEIIKLSNWPLDIDQHACERRGVRVKLIRQHGAISVAEQAMALALTCAKQVLPGHIAVAEGRYREFGLEPATTADRSFKAEWVPIHPFELYGRTLGIVGLGEIGRELAVRANAFSMNILYYKRNRLPEWIEKELRATYSELDRLLEKSDFVSLHVPHAPETEKMIGRDELRRMKHTAYLINTSRGGVIDQEALVTALRTRQIAGAGLDVFNKEPVPYDDPILSLDNVVLSPHAGGGSHFGLLQWKTDVRQSIERALGIEVT